jgi:hypothetical protein
MSGAPPSVSFCHITSRFCLAFSFFDGSKFRMNEIEGLNLNRGPALIAMNRWPAKSNVTTSVSPEGVSRRVVLLVIRESGKTLV